MAACRCGADILWVQARDGGKVAIEARAASSRGPGRYRIVDHRSSPWLAERLDPRAEGAGYEDHRLNCPAVSAADRSSLIQALSGDDDAAAHGGPPAGQ